MPHRPSNEAAPPHPFANLTFAPVENPGPGQRWSTWLDVERGARGPCPLPAWVVTDQAALDTELGILKTGKEADIFLVERAVPGRADRSVVMAAKLLCRLWTAGLSVPYPVQLDGTELLLQFIHVDGQAAPRLAQTRPARPTLEDYFDQVRSAMLGLAALGLAHGDLSAYNLLAQGERIVVIDLPQVVDVVANPLGAEFLLRDCRNVCTWFHRRGLDVAEDALFADLLSHVF